MEVTIRYVYVTNRLIVPCSSRPAGQEDDESLFSRYAWGIPKLPPRSARGLPEDQAMKRREFIASTVALTAGAGIAACDAETGTDSEKAEVKRYQRLGNTDLVIGDISFGAGRLPSASLVLRAIDRGVNYFDTAPDYGPSEEHIGRALKRFKQRDKIYIASKYCRNGPYEAGISHLLPGSSVADYKAAVEGSLGRLGTDYLDVVFVHAMGERKGLEGERKRLFDPSMLQATRELKQEGKVRYLAVSSHGPNHMETLLTEAVESGHFDIIMPAFNFMKFPRVPEVLKQAKARGVGVVAMKTLAGAKAMDLDPEGDVFAHAAFKWVLRHSEVAGLVITMKRVSDIDRYLGASGAAFTAADQRALDRYAAIHGSDYCRTGCGDCEPHCPQGVPIASILRYQMYFEDYGEEKQAMAAYAGLGRSADVCSGCSLELCTGACPHGLPVAGKLRAAHRTLSLETVA
jgi:predicted aldo/keto reductase-like oxidoreductase